MIDYKLLNTAIKYYESRGYQRIEVPWMVTEAVDSITRPSNIEPLNVFPKDKNLIASGEQGFLYLMLKGYLPKGKYQTLTPCFRNDSYDLTHSKQFMKIELIDTLDLKYGITTVLNSAECLFKNIFVDGINIVEIDKDIYDIEYNNIELGSYGKRKYKHLEWVYGTGLAEPRTSRLLKL